MTVSEALRYELSKRKGPVEYSDLRAHLERDAVFLVSPELDLVDCGVSVANDEVSVVREWLRDQKLRKPSQAERDAWPEDSTRRWIAIVVQPFVLVQPAPDS